MKKILFVSTNDWVPWGGSEELWYKTALLLKEQGFDVYVSVRLWLPKPEHIIKLEAAGCKMDFRISAKPIPFYKRVFNKVFNTKSKSFQVLDEIKPDLVFINQGSISDGLGYGEACIERNINYTFIVHLVHELNVWSDPFVNQLIKVFAKAKFVFFVSFQSKSLFEFITASKIDNACIVRNPSKETALVPYPVSNETFNIAFIASLSSFHKGHDMLFQILKSDKWKQRNIRFNLFGNGPNEEALKRLKETLGLENVHFSGFEPNLQKIYGHNQAFILCSRMEGQSLALIEAMYCGRVPIVTNVGGAEELIDNGINGFIATSPNIYEIDQNLENAWNQRHEWEEIGKMAAQKVRQVLSGDPVQIFAQKLKEIIDGA